jgi:hypothetical protein
VVGIVTLLLAASGRVAGVGRRRAGDEITLGWVERIAI